MTIEIKQLRNLASAMEITKYPNSPLIKSVDDKSVLVFSDENKEYILGYITKSDVSSTLIVYSQYFSGSYGRTLNDMYNNIQNSDDVGSTISLKRRTLLKGHNNFIGSIFHDGDLATKKYSFSEKGFWQDVDYSLEENPLSPIAPLYSDESYFILLDGGNKIYKSSSGSLEEANAMRINIGVSGTDIHSFGNWTASNLTSETPVNRLTRVISEGTYASGARTGYPDPSTYHIYNFVDNSSFFMGNSIIEIEKSNADNSVFARTVYDAEGVKIEVDENSIVSLKVNTAELIIDQNNIHIKGATLNYQGDLYVSGLLMVSGTATVKGATDLESTVDITGKLTTTGGNALG